MSAPCCGSRRDTYAMLKSLRVEAAEAGGGNVAKQMQQNEADCLRRLHRRGGEKQSPERGTWRQEHWTPEPKGPPDEQHHLRKKAQSLLLT